MKNFTNAIIRLNSELILSKSSHKMTKVRLIKAILHDFNTSKPQKAKPKHHGWQNAIVMQLTI